MGKEDGTPLSEQPAAEFLHWFRFQLSTLNQAIDPQTLTLADRYSQIVKDRSRDALRPFNLTTRQNEILFGLLYDKSLDVTRTEWDELGQQFREIEGANGLKFMFWCMLEPAILDRRPFLPEHAKMGERLNKLSYTLDLIKEEWCL